MKLVLILFIVPIILFGNIFTKPNQKISYTSIINNEILINQDTTIIVKVKGITCSNDIELIKSNVNKLSGIVKCEVTKTGNISFFMISYNKIKISLKDIYSAIENSGACCKDPSVKPYKVKL